MLIKSKEMPPFEEAVAYYRYSTKNQTEVSIELQRTAIQNYCEEHNLKLVREYTDRGHSGSTANRPEFQTMMKDAIEKPSWSKVLVYDRSRFSRSIADCIYYEKELRRSHINLISVTRPLGDSPEDEMARGIEDVMNNYDINKSSQRTHAALQTRAMQGLHCGGLPPLGYEVDEAGRLIINEKEAEIVQLIFSMYLDGYSYTQIAEYLNSKGYKSKRGRKFTKHSFNSILTQTKYNGDYTWNKTKSKDSRAKRNSHAYKLVNEQILLTGKLPPIIDAESFQKVQEKMSQRTLDSARSKSGGRYLLGNMGKLKCRYCGSELVGISRSSHGTSYATYGCPQHRKAGCKLKEIRVEKVDELVTIAVTRELLRPNTYDFWQGECQKIGYKADLLKEKKEIKKQIEKLAANLENQESQTLTALLIQKEQRLKEISAFFNSSQTLAVNNQENRSRLKKDIQAQLEQPGNVTARRLLSTCIDSIIVDNDVVEINLNM